MSSRGPKIRTAVNAHRDRKDLIRHESFDPPCRLTRAAKKEYERLIGVLSDKGTIDRVDLSSVAECARLKALLDLAHKATAKGIDWEKARLVGLLSSQHRGRLRELGLTTRPNLSMVRTNPVPAEATEDDPVASMIKLSG